MYTKALWMIQDAQERLRKEAQNTVSDGYAKDVRYVPYLVNINGPVIPVSKERVRNELVHQMADLAGVYRVLIEAEKNAPRPLMTAVLINATSGMSQPRSHEQGEKRDPYDEFEAGVLEEPLTDADIDILLVLTEPSWNSRKLPLRSFMPGKFNTSQQRRLKSFVSKVEGSFSSGLWPEVADPWVSIGGLLRTINTEAGD